MQSQPEDQETLAPGPWASWRQRLRKSAGPTLAFATLAVLVNSTLNLFGSGAAEFLQKNGALAWLARWFLGDILPSLAAALVVLGCLRLSAERAADMARRPWRFALILVTSAAIGTLAVWQIESALGRANFSSSTELKIKLFNIWQQIMYCGTLFGWLYVLYLRRTEDRAQFALLQTKRSLLKRQMAHSRLLATRAKIEPEMVARVLRETRTRYLTEPLQASALLEHMIGYLRLAMNRGRDPNPTLSSELILFRSYLALREAEMGLKIRFEVEHEVLPANQKQPTPAPVFLVLQSLLAQALVAGSTTIALRLRMGKGDMQLELDTGVVALGPENLSRLAAEIKERVFAGTVILLPTCNNGVNVYVVQINIPG